MSVTDKLEEYILLLPFTPSKRDNLAAWLTARCDGENYGKIRAYTFPRDRLIYGPKQIDARINQDSFISQQLSLWNQRGSEDFTTLRSVSFVRVSASMRPEQRRPLIFHSISPLLSIKL